MRALPAIIASVLIASASAPVKARADQPTLVYRQNILLCGSVTWEHPPTQAAEPADVQLALENRKLDIISAVPARSRTELPKGCAARTPHLPPKRNQLARTTAYFAFLSESIGGPGDVAVSRVTQVNRDSPYHVICAYRQVKADCTGGASIPNIPATKQVDLYINFPGAPAAMSVLPAFNGPIMFATDQQPANPLASPQYFQNERLASTVLDCNPVNASSQGASQPPVVQGSPLTGNGCFMSYGTISGDGTVTSQSFQDFQKSLSTIVTSNHLVILLHGFNSNFANTIQNARTLSAYLSEAAGTTGKTAPNVLVYGWPAKAADYVLPFSILKYPDDETNSSWAALHLRELLANLLASNPSLTIDVVAHSMGNRLMLDSLLALREQTYAQNGDRFPCSKGSGIGNYCQRIGQMISIEPDVDMQTYAEDVMRLSDFVSGITLYGSHIDRALEGSRVIHGHCRAGRLDCEGTFWPTSSPPTNMNVIDASEFTQCDPIAYHSYWPQSTTVLRDISQIVTSGTIMPPAAPLPLAKDMRKYLTVLQTANIPFAHYAFTNFDPDDTCR